MVQVGNVDKIGKEIRTRNVGHPVRARFFNKIWLDCHTIATVEIDLNISNRKSNP